MLDFGLANTKKSIDQTMNSLFKNNYEMQASVLQNEMERQGDEHVDAI
jgi:TATA-binding protein-associated factor Taf7